MIEDILMFLGTSKKTWIATLASRSILTTDKLVKTTIVYGRMLTICENLQKE